MRTRTIGKHLRHIAALLLIPVFALLLFSGCARETYTVTVVGGTGGGEFSPGATCTVTAEVPEGLHFIQWSVDGKKFSTENPCTFEVTENTRITAICDEDGVLILDKSVGGNPIGGFGVGDDTFDSFWTTESEPWQEGDLDYSDVITYGGDPAVLVEEKDGVETAYLYVGHDITTEKITSTYTMPEWICYSSTDLIHWKTESIIMDVEDIPWAQGQASGVVTQSAWASQVVKYEDYYWFFFCTWSEAVSSAVTANERGQMCIGVAVSDSPTGPFKCYNEPLVYSSWTNNTEEGRQAGDLGWNDIDPTAYVTPEGEFYVAWGNSNSFMCQVDMIRSSGKENGTGYNVALAIVDQSESTSGNLVTTDDPTFYWYSERGGDIEGIADIMRIDLTSQAANDPFTEAPYLYMRETASGYRYYMFYASNWREALAYSYVDTATADGVWEAQWTFGSRLMDPTATSNTNHPAVFDFGGKTYMIYHNGSLPYGCGYRRVACIAELEFDENGMIAAVVETSTGLEGVTSKITQNDVPIAHATSNPHADSAYPLNLETYWGTPENADEGLWEIEEAKYVPEGKGSGSYVSIQAYNMAGLYLSYDLSTGAVTITQDDERVGSAASDAEQMRMSFRTLPGENGTGVMFQCAENANYYLAVTDGKLVVTDSATAAQRTFRVQTETANRSWGYEYNEGV